MSQTYSGRAKRRATWGKFDAFRNIVEGEKLFFCVKIRALLTFPSNICLYPLRPVRAAVSTSPNNPDQNVQEINVIPASAFMPDFVLSACICKGLIEELPATRQLLQNLCCPDAFCCQSCCLETISIGAPPFADYSIQSCSDKVMEVLHLFTVHAG